MCSGRCFIVPKRNEISATGILLTALVHTKDYLMPQTDDRDRSEDSQTWQKSPMEPIFTLFRNTFLRVTHTWKQFH